MSAPTTPVSKRSTIYEEEIVIKPSTELIPDEYEHTTNENINLHIFQCDDAKSETQMVVDTFRKIGYTVEDDKKIHKLDTELDGTLNHISNDCVNADALILIFLGYYKKKGKIHLGEDQHYDIQNIWKKFTTKNCPHLKNKPKIFIISMLLQQHSSKVHTDGLQHFTARFASTYDTPSEADILVVYQTSQTESDFTTSLCSNINKYGKSEDLITLASCIENEHPLMISTLTRKFYTTISNNRGHHLVINENTEDLLEMVANLNKRLTHLEQQQTEKKDKVTSNFFSKIFRNESMKDNKRKEKKIKKAESIKEKKEEAEKRRNTVAAGPSKAETSGRKRNNSINSSNLDVDKKAPPRKLSVSVEKKQPPWK